MAMHSFRSLLLHTLAQPELDLGASRALVAHFHCAAYDWTLFDQLVLPAALPATRDPLVLALRRIGSCAFGELRAMHRVAALQAAQRPFGLLGVALGEAARLEHAEGPPPPFGDDPAFRRLNELLPKEVLEHERPALYDLRARVFGVGARRLIARDLPYYRQMIGLAQTWAGRGSQDVELQAFLTETRALAHENEGNLGPAIELRTEVVERLFEYPVVDRAAEAMVDLAELVEQLAGGASSEAEWLYERAEEKLALLSADLNLPLRRRLTTWREGQKA